MFIPYIPLRHNRALRSPILQELMTHFPTWTRARSDKHSNMQALLSPFSMFLEDFQRYAFEASRTQASASETLDWSKAYNWPIDTSFAFNFVDRFDGEVEYETPDLVQGFIGARSATLTECHERNPEYLLVDTPDYLTLDTPLALEETNQVGDGDTLHLVEFTLSVDMYLKLTATWDADAEIGINIGGNHWLPQITLINVDDEDDRHQLSIFGDGLYGFPQIIRAGKWRIETFALKDCTLNLNTEGHGTGFAFERAHKYSNVVESFDFSYRIGEDPSYLEYVTHAPGGTLAHLSNDEDYVAQEAVALLDEDGNPIAAVDLVKPMYHPWLWILADDNVLHLYDTYLEQPSYLYDNAEDYGLHLQYDSYDFRVGDEVCFKATRKAMFMKEEFIRLRLKVLHTDLDGVETISWILPNGTTAGDAESAWIGVNPNAKYWRDKTWNLTIGDFGSYKLVLEAEKRKVGSLSERTSPSVASEAVIQARAKTPRLSVSLSSAGLGPGRAANGLRLDAEALKVIDDLSQVYNVALESHKYYLDYEDYVLYTLTNFDSIDVTVT
jgi:hypothetical protein